MNTTSFTGTPSGPVQLSREQILDVTTRCLRESGYDGTTIRTLAGLLGCAVGSIYRYFRDKHELLSAVTQQVLEPVAAVVEAGGSFEQSVRLYHQLATHAPETYHLMFWLAAPTTGAAATTPPKLPQVVERIVKGWARLLGEPAAWRSWSILHGHIMLGRDAAETLDAIRPETPTAAAATPVSFTERPADPRVVITMTQPPAPALVADVAQVAAAAPEDVCLL